MSYTHLSKDERKCIHRWRIEGVRVSEMASRLARHRSTIHRELARNAAGPNSYVDAVAHARYRKRMRWPRRRPKRDDVFLLRLVENRLKQLWSPQQIAERFKRHTYALNTKRWISQSTIYRHIHETKLHGADWHTYLRRYGNQRPKRYGQGADGRGRIVDRVLIDERPKQVERQQRVGDFEGDTMHGPGRKGGIATFVERKTLYTLAAWIHDRSTTALNNAAKECFRAVPHKQRHTLTVDNGPEFRNHKGLSQAIGIEVYFAHAYASWQRPINENTNGLLRQYFPKKQPGMSITSRDVQHAVNELNHRPRKKLGYRTPHEVFWQACRT